MITLDFGRVIDMHQISLDRDGGELFGYVVDAKDESILNYLEKHTNLSKAIVQTLRKTNETVALLRNLMVEPELRGQGIGSDLVMEFMSEADQLGASCFILIADAEEIQENDLDLTGWYEQFGFQKVMNTTSGPFMVMGDHVVEAFNRAFNVDNDSSLDR
jgi:N-acetylglutamate synthase-like GNAT family acetyltransferase